MELGTKSQTAGQPEPERIVKQAKKKKEKGIRTKKENMEQETVVALSDIYE